MSRVNLFSVLMGQKTKKKSVGGGSHPTSGGRGLRDTFYVKIVAILTVQNSLFPWKLHFIFYGVLNCSMTLVFIPIYIFHNLFVTEIVPKIADWAWYLNNHRSIPSSSFYKHNYIFFHHAKLSLRRDLKSVSIHRIKKWSLRFTCCS